MALSRYLIGLTALLTVGTTAVYGDTGSDGKSRFQQDLEESDMEMLNDFINSKRKIPLIDKSKKLKISGELHTEWNYYTEKIDGENVRTFVFREQEVLGDEVFNPGETIAIGHNDYDIECDLFVDWDTDRTWARIHLRFDNSAGVDDNGLDPKIDPKGYHGSGYCANLCLKECYVGYEIFKCGDRRLTIELGRRGNIYKAFYSEIQFASRLDGVIFKYANKWKNYTDWYIQWAGFVVDERATQYAWVAELGLSNMLNAGLDFKYSFIDWHKGGRNRFGKKNPLGFRFKVSQFSLIYRIKPELLWGHQFSVFGAFLVNHTPSGYTYIDGTPGINEEGRVIYTRTKVKIGRHQNLGAFVGIQFRELYREGDWMFKALVAYCEAQCCPDNDVRNIGTGNFLRDSFTSDGRGNTNWKGYAIKFGYAITDNWVVETQYDHSWSIDNQIAGTHGFTRYCLETTYSF
ncbi:MAG: hypothetical protein H0U49_08155 [Parachlamydiaceae bacterium]|nr:hypothetical protein [Parachlamydiaceae bacterium]